MNRNIKSIVQKLSLSVVLMSSTVGVQAMNIEETIENAIIHNPEFRQEVKAYRAIQAEVRNAKSNYYPTIDLNAGIGYEEVDRSGINNTGDGLTRRETSIKLTQNLFEGFATQSETARQQFRLDAQAFQAVATASDIALEMAEAFVGLLRQTELLKLAQDNLDTHLKILDQITKRSEAGIGNQVEVDQAKARLALAQSNYGSAQNNFYDARASFRRVLGRNPDNDLVKPKFYAKLPATLEEATNTSLLDHPTIQSANADILEAKQQYDTAKRGYYPTVDLEIEKTFDNNLSGVEGKNEFFQAMIRMRYNLYNGGRDSSERKRTASSYHQAAEIRNNTRRQIIENLRLAWNANVYIGDQLQYINQHIKLTHETLLGYRKQFSLGRRSLLDLLNTENEYVGALRTLINSEADQLIAKYRILAGTGHLLEELNIEYSFIAAEREYDGE